MEVVVLLECLRNRWVCTEVDLLLTGPACPSSWDYFSTKFSCRLLFGPTVVPYFACNERFIYLLLMHTFFFSLPFPPSVVCLPVFLLLVFLSTSRLFLCFPDNFPSDFWDFDQDALPDGLVQGLADRRKTTVLSSTANCSSLLYHRVYRKWKESPLLRLTGVFPPLNPFMFHWTYNTLQSHSNSVIDSVFNGIKWAHSMAGTPFPTDNPIVEAVRSASKVILGTAIVNLKEPISSTVIHDLSD